MSLLLRVLRKLETYRFNAQVLRARLYHMVVLCCRVHGLSLAQEIFILRKVMEQKRVQDLQFVRVSHSTGSVVVW